MKTPRVAILSGAGELSSCNLTLAKELNLPLVTNLDAIDKASEFYLHYDNEGLSLYNNLEETKGAVRVNFDSTALHRRSKDGLLRQNLIKAMATKQKKQLRVLDAMSGLGSDAFLLARAGYHVTMLERNEIVFAILQDGLHRGSNGLPDTRDALTRMMLVKGDFLEKGDELGTFDVLYLDPMFPVKRGTARSKKSMHLLQQLLGQTDEDLGLLDFALSKARNRVVVKRAKHSPNCNNRHPQISFKGSSSRYDVSVSYTHLTLPKILLV